MPSRASLLEREAGGDGDGGAGAGKAKAATAGATHVVSIETANLRGGELREAGAGVWLALFDGAGKCAVQHVVPRADLCFDRGTRETLAVRAEGLGDVQRVWIGPGASTWLPEKVTGRVVNVPPVAPASIEANPSRRSLAKPVEAMPLSGFCSVRPLK